MRYSGFFGVRETWVLLVISWNTLQATNISPKKWHFEDDFPFPKVGYVSFLEGKPNKMRGQPLPPKKRDHQGSYRICLPLLENKPWKLSLKGLFCKTAKKKRLGKPAKFWEFSMGVLQLPSVETNNRLEGETTFLWGKRLSVANLLLILGRRA